METLDGPHVSKLKPSIEEPPTLELKTIPSHLKYAFLEKDSKFPVVISSFFYQMCKTKNCFECSKNIRDHWDGS